MTEPKMNFWEKISWMYEGDVGVLLKEISLFIPTYKQHKKAATLLM